MSSRWTAKQSRCPAHFDNDDVFDISTSLRIVNSRLDVDVTIQPAFLQEVDRSTFVLLDFYRSRGVYALLTSRLPVAEHRSYGKLLAKVVGTLKSQRDEAFKQAVLSDIGDCRLSPASFGQSVTRPKNKRLRLGTMAGPESLEVKAEQFSMEFAEFRLSVLRPADRSNGNSQLWVDSKAESWNYISKLVAHMFEVDDSKVDPLVVSQNPADRATGSTDGREALLDLTNIEGSTAVVPQEVSEELSQLLRQSPSKRQANLFSFGVRHADQPSI